MRENLHGRESERQEGAHELQELKELLALNTENEIDIEYHNGTYEIEADSFSLTFTIEDEVFEIRSIEARGVTEGLGRVIVLAIHTYADESGYEVIASNVLDTAHGFWEKMGYQEGEDGEWYRV